MADSHARRARLKPAEGERTAEVGQRAALLHPAVEVGLNAVVHGVEVVGELVAAQLLGAEKGEGVVRLGLVPADAHAHAQHGAQRLPVTHRRLLLVAHHRLLLVAHRGGVWNGARFSLR